MRPYCPFSRALTEQREGDRASARKYLCACPPADRSSVLDCVLRAVNAPAGLISLTPPTTPPRLLAIDLSAGKANKLVGR